MCNLNASQVQILQCLAKLPPEHDGLTVAQITDKTGATATTGNLGPSSPAALQASNGESSGSLYGLGLVKPQQAGTGAIVTWIATAKGRKMAHTYRTKSRTADEDKVPVKLLDRVVQSFRGTRTYGLELYNQNDLQEVRTALGDDYAHVQLSSLQLQICNRRKQGAYADPLQKRVKAIERAIREFGPKGTVLQGFLSQRHVFELLQALEPTDPG